MTICYPPPKPALSEAYLKKRDIRESLPTNLMWASRANQYAARTGQRGNATALMMGTTPYGVPGALPPALMYGAMVPNSNMLGSGSQQQTRHARRVYVGGITGTRYRSGVSAF